MKTYGVKRCELRACDSGCCPLTPLLAREQRGSSSERAYRKRARHRARQQAKIEARAE